MKKISLLLLLIPTILIGQSKQDVIVIKDTVGIDEIEWKDYYTLNKKENNEPFTGVVKFEGELNYRNNKKGRFLQSNNYISAVTFVSSRINGLYTMWGRENGQKKSEITLSADYEGRIRGNGPYTLWYINGQMADKGFLKNGKRDSKRTTWYKNGQLKSEASYQYGKPYGNSMTWDENGEKSLESSYLDGNVIKRIERDKNGKIVKEWPEVDDDKYGLRIFLDNFLSMLKTESYNDIEKLLASKEDYMAIVLRHKGEEPSDEMLEEINDNWAKNISNKINDLKKQVTDYKFIFENQNSYKVRHTYRLINEDKSTEKIKWPKSINYNLSTARYVVAEITIILEHLPFKIELTPIYLNNIWCFIATEEEIIRIEEI